MISHERIWNEFESSWTLSIAAGDKVFLLEVFSRLIVIIVVINKYYKKTREAITGSQKMNEEAVVQVEEEGGGWGGGFGFLKKRTAKRW